MNEVKKNVRSYWKRFFLSHFYEFQLQNLQEKRQQATLI